MNKNCSLKENLWLNAAICLMTIASSVMVIDGAFFNFGQTKLYNFLLGGVTMLTAMAYAVLMATDSMQHRKLGLLHTGIVIWFAVGMLRFSYAIWCAK